MTDERKIKDAKSEVAGSMADLIVLKERLPIEDQKGRQAIRRAVSVMAGIYDGLGGDEQ